jgi:radical SAM protein with 4Fe4S-binding SPASM domain
MRSARRWQYFKNGLKIFSDITLRGRYDFEWDLMPCHSSNLGFPQRLNLLKAGGNLVYRNPQPWSWPIYMQIELTNYCNLRCEVCPTGIGAITRKSLSMDPALFERLIKETGHYLLKAALWAWGEPLLHPAISDILRLQHGRGINTILSTNGQNLDDDRVLQALIDHPPTYLIVCLDGTTDETNAKFRVGAKLAPAQYGVKELARMKKERNSQFPILHHRFIAMKHNEHELAELPEFSTRNHFDMLTVRSLSIIDAPDDRFEKLKPEGQNLQAYEYQDGRRVSRSDFVCERAFVSSTVLADGTVIICDQDFNGQQPLGILGEGTTFNEIWRGKRSIEIRKAIRSEPDRFSFCRNCPFKDRPANDCSIRRIELQRA